MKIGYLVTSISIRVDLEMSNDIISKQDNVGGYEQTEARSKVKTNDNSLTWNLRTSQGL